MSLERLLRHQHEALNLLHDLLQEEQALLLARQVDGEALNEVAARKQETLAHLDRLDQARRAGLRKLGYADDSAGAAHAAADLNCTASWEKVRAAAEATSHLNRVNGTLIGQRMQHNMNALRMLTEMTARTPYGEDGRLQARSGQLSSSA